MQFRLIALAALAASGAAHALTPAQIDAARADGSLKTIYLSGASAQRLFVGSYMKSICNTTDFDVFYNGTTATNFAGNNYRAYSCTLKSAVDAAGKAVKYGNYVAGTKILVIKRDQGGSTVGTVNLAGSDATNAAAGGDFIQMMKVTAANCLQTSNPSPSTDINKAGWSCTTSTLDSVQAHAGFSDLEPKMLAKPVNLPNVIDAAATDGIPGNSTLYTPAPDFTMLDSKATHYTNFGVGVSKALYLALQKTQGLAPLTATVADIDTYPTPSLPRTFVRLALTGKISGGAVDGNTWGLVVSSAVDAAVASKQVNVCRRNIGSGTQSAFNAYFLASGCLADGLTPIGQETNAKVYPSSNTVTPANVAGASTTNQATGSLYWELASSAGVVQTCLTNSNNANAYALGVLSLENNPQAAGLSAANSGYRFVGIDGVAPTRYNAIRGLYDFAYAATMQFNKNLYLVQTSTAYKDAKAFVSKMRTDLPSVANIAAIDADSAEGVMSLPSAYTGNWADATDPLVQLWGSRVGRNTTNLACNSLVYLK